MKKIIASLVFIALLPMALIVGCDTKTTTPSSPAGPAATATPNATVIGGIYLTPQTTPQPMVVLGTAANYVILAYTGITSSGPSTTCGGYGLYPGSSVTASPSIVESCGGAIDVNDPTANIAKQNLATAYTDIMTRPNAAIIPAGADIGGATIYPGLYTDGGNLNLASADLHLDAQGNTSAVFIFQIHGNLIVGPGRQVILANGANPANVFWGVTGYGALNTTVSFVGNILSYTSVTLNTGATLLGRALGSNGNVTLLTNTITHP